jgi:hypothetical protein
MVPPPAPGRRGCACELQRGRSAAKPPSLVCLAKLHRLQPSHAYTYTKSSQLRNPTTASLLQSCMPPMPNCQHCTMGKHV